MLSADTGHAGPAAEKPPYSMMLPPAGFMVGWCLFGHEPFEDSDFCVGQRLTGDKNKKRSEG